MALLVTILYWHTLFQSAIIVNWGLGYYLLAMERLLIGSPHNLEQHDFELTEPDTL